jgi:hypothetical protein
MNTTGKTAENRKMERDRQLGKSLTGAIASTVSQEQCPSLEEIAALVDGTLQESRRDEIMGHLAGCDTCYQVFLSTKKLVREHSGNTSKVFIPPLIAVAVVMAVALCVVLKQTGTENQTIAVRVEKDVPQAAKPGQETAPVLTAREGARPGKLKEPAPMTARTLAGMLASTIEPERLRKIPGSAAGRAYGFADKADTEVAAFRLGVSCTDLELALQLEDRESALMHLNRILSLLDTFDRKKRSVYSLEQARNQLEADAPLGKFRGVTDGLRAVFLNRPRLFLSFGEWCEAARFAAAAESRTFFSTTSISHLQNILPPKNTPAESVKALSTMLTQLQGREVSRSEFALLEKRITAVIQQY